MLNNNTITSILFSVVLVSVSGISVANEWLAADKVKALFSGKTVDWVNVKKGYSATAYFNTDGMLKGMRDGSVPFQYDWNVNSEGELCIGKSSQTLCRPIEKSGDEYHKIKVKNNGKRIHLITYKNFVDGNPNNY